MPTLLSPEPPLCLLIFPLHWLWPPTAKLVSPLPPSEAQSAFSLVSLGGQWRLASTVPSLLIATRGPLEAEGCKQAATLASVMPTLAAGRLTLLYEKLFVG